MCRRERSYGENEWENQIFLVPEQYNLRIYSNLNVCEDILGISCIATYQINETKKVTANSRSTNFDARLCYLELVIN